jgi:hypothetical protein
MHLTAQQVAWLGNGERGMSSDALFERLTGFPSTRTPFRKAHPVDPDDFRRCHLMLEQCGLVDRVAEAADMSACWSRLAPRWAEIVACFDAECGDWRARHSDWHAQKTYELIDSILERRLQGAHNI